MVHLQLVVAADEFLPVRAPQLLRLLLRGVLATQECCVLLSLQLYYDTRTLQIEIKVGVTDKFGTKYSSTKIYLLDCIWKLDTLLTQARSYYTYLARDPCEANVGQVPFLSETNIFQHEKNKLVILSFYYLCSAFVCNFSDKHSFKRSILGKRATM